MIDALSSARNIDTSLPKTHIRSHYIILYRNTLLHELSPGKRQVFICEVQSHIDSVHGP